MTEVIGDTESVTINSGETEFYPDGLQVSGTLQVSGRAVVGSPAPSFVGKSRADGTQNVITRNDGTQDVIKVANGVLD